MATGKTTPRAKVRLRLDKGTLLLRQFGVTSIMCSIVDLSEAGCQCHFSIADLDAETATAWAEILSPGRVLSVELTEPTELRNLIFRESQVRWLKTTRGGDLDFGLQFGALDNYQKEVLSTAMMQFASEKLRARKAAEALTKTHVKRSPSVSAEEPTPVPRARPVQVAESSSRNAVPVAATHTPAGGTRTTRSFNKTKTEARLTATRSRQSFDSEPPPAPAPDPTGIGERQKRQNLVVAALFEFCDSKGGQWENGIHQGRTIDLNEGGFRLEGPAPDCCPPEELLNRNGHTIVLIKSSSKDLRCLCRVRTAMPSTNMQGFWTYGVQIIDMSDDDRRGLRELYIRAGFTQIIKRR